MSQKAPLRFRDLTQVEAVAKVMADNQIVHSTSQLFKQCIISPNHYSIQVRGMSLPSL